MSTYGMALRNQLTNESEIMELQATNLIEAYDKAEWHAILNKGWQAVPFSVRHIQTSD